MHGLIPLGIKSQLRMAERMKVLLTGASGMLGSALWNDLEVSPSVSKIFRLQRLSQPKTAKNSSQISLSEAAAYKFDVVIHAGSPASPVNHTKPADVFTANVHHTEALVDTVDEGGLFIYISTGEVYGPSADSPISEDAHPLPVLLGPRSYYPLAKLSGESISQSRRDVRVVIFRLFHTFGPGVKRGDGRSFGDFLWGAATTGKVPLASSGTAVRSFMGSEDFVRAVRLAMTDKSMNGIYNLGSPLPMSIYGFAELVCEVSGASLVMEKRTNNLIPSPISIHFPDTKKLEFHGWDRHQTLDDAVEKTLREIRIQANL